MRIGFLESSTGEASSKRLAFIFCQPFIAGLAVYLIKELVATDPKTAYKVFVAFCIYSSLLGGMVTSELLLKIFGKKK